MNTGPWFHPEVPTRTPSVVHHTLALGSLQRIYYHSTAFTLAWTQLTAHNKEFDGRSSMLLKLGDLTVYKIVYRRLFSESKMARI
jgi:hypothetical protein